MIPVKMIHEKMSEVEKICAVIVLYYPSFNQIETILNFIKNEDIFLIIVDNTPEKKVQRLKSISESNPKFTYRPLLVNVGIAKAQNLGILGACNICGIKYIIFLDQDSIIENGFAKKMLTEYRAIENKGFRIAALGPTPIKMQDGQAYKQRIPKNKKNSSFYISSIIISSGMFVRLSDFKTIGLMDENLFIDTVDFEWCWRAKSKGYSCYITKRVEMLHQVGEKEKSLLGFRFVLSKPIRYYYQYRNYILLSFRPYVPVSWKVKSFIKRLFLIFYILSFSKSRIESLKFISKGIKNGFSKAILSKMKRASV